MLMSLAAHRQPGHGAGIVAWPLWWLALGLLDGLGFLGWAVWTGKNTWLGCLAGLSVWVKTPVWCIASGIFSLVCS